MTAIRTIIDVAKDGTISGRVPADSPPGDHPAEVTVADEPASPEPWEFPVDDFGPSPQGLSLRREDLYGDDGR